MDDLGLLRDGDRDGPSPRRPWGLPVAALVTTLLMVGVLVSVASWVTGGGGGLTPAAASPEVTTPTPTGTTEVATPTPDATTETPFPTGEPAPLPTSPVPTTARTVRPTLPPPPPPDPQLVRVPAVTGQRLLGAVLTLRAAGFEALVPGGAVPGPLPDRRRVSAQSPPGGTLAPSGSVVVLEVDSG